MDDISIKQPKESDCEIDFESPTPITMVNGANLNADKQEASIYMDHINEDENTAWIMELEQGDRFGDFFDRLPFGVLNKVITGIGATSLEIKTQVRDSIIVVPTKSLAYNKHIWAESELGEGSSMYVGSAMKAIRTSVTTKDIKRYLSIDNGKKKKFLVVADSLEKVIKAVGERVYDDFFLMVDEIDTMQSDSPYRPRLEKVIDYYFKFKRENRACVTATLRDFSNENLSRESYVTTIWKKLPSREITLIHTNFVDDVAINKINELLSQSDEDKILVAYNSLDGILNIIGQLDEAVQANCGILCSERSYNKASDFLGDEVIDGVLGEDNYLQKRIVFLTCSYFAGIDIEDECHLISISTNNQPFTLLSTGRLAQIAGRCRNGRLSEHIIYDTKSLDDKSTETEEGFRKKHLNKANKIAQVLTNLESLTQEDEDFAAFKQYAESFLDFKAKGKVAENYSTAIVRKSFDGFFVPAYFNIDALLEKFNLHHELYSEMEALPDALSNHKIFFKQWYIKKENHNAKVITAIKDRNEERLVENLQKAKHDIVEWLGNGGKYWHEFLQCISPKVQDKEVEKFYDRFEKFYGYIDPVFLLDALIANHETKAFTRFNNALAFWILDETHPFKAYVLAQFYNHTSSQTRHKRRVTTEQKNEKMMDIFRNTELIVRKISPQTAAELFSCFFIKRRIGARYDKLTKKQISPAHEKIMGLNPLRLPPPIATIKERIDLYNLFVLPYS